MSDFDIMTNFVINNFIENVVCVNTVNEDNCVRNDFHKPLSDPFTQTEQLIFIKNFHLTKHVARCLIDMLRQFLKVPSCLSSIDIDTKV